MKSPNILDGFFAREKPLTPEQIRVLPKLNEVVYEIPIGRTTKSCSNCFMWSSDNHCMIHAPDRLVFGFDNCSYHLPLKPNTEPATKRVNLPLVPVEPEMSGLGLYPSGTRCGSCIHFRPGAGAKTTAGLCARVRQDFAEKYAAVDAYGCCARYVGG